MCTEEDTAAHLAVLLIPEIYLKTFMTGIISVGIRIEIISVLELPGSKNGLKTELIQDTD